MDDLTEIERRFLVDGREDKPWRRGKQFKIQQHYNIGALLHVHEHALYLNDVHATNLTERELDLLRTVDSWTTRLRKRDEAYIMTYKSRLSDDTAYELEWSVSADLARRILNEGPFPCVEKIRYVLEGSDGFLWEVDEFEGPWPGWSWLKLNCRQAKPRWRCRHGLAKKSQGCARGQIAPLRRRFQTKRAVETTASMTR